ncbi:hypothetical protein [Richelia intracellularis]|uniref:hypothetical protein n=1 Tax=Richelia intracellularis TaxID=1164990 RepID=UPI0018C8D216|nr:hypothetical protein [Richelia intracellularis]
MSILNSGKLKVFAAVTSLNLFRETYNSSQLVNIQNSDFHCLQGNKYQWDDERWGKSIKSPHPNNKSSKSANNLSLQTI